MVFLVSFGFSHGFGTTNVGIHGFFWFFSGFWQA
jgi:hypothetical protein